MRPNACIIALLLTFNLSRAQPLNYYFGNLHAHTAFSDGNKDSVSSGVGRPDGSYAYAKLSNDFDFLGISEHNHYSAAHSPGFKLPRYQVGLQMADAANQEGSFLAMYGMEYGISSGNNGHVIIYGFNQLIGWESNVGGQIGNNYDIYNPKSDYDALFRKIKNNPAAFAYLAHPYWTDFSSNGKDSGAIAFSDYNAMYDSAIVGIPLRSGVALSNAEDYKDYSTGDYFNYYKKMLWLGYHLGMGYDHDNHYTNFGRSNGGRLVIMAPSLTRANLRQAMQQMHFYGSDDSNAKIDFSINGKGMGSIITDSFYPSIKVTHDDPDGETADSIKIWKGRKNSGGLWAEVIYVGLNTNTCILNDTELKTGLEYFYFAEIKQKDQQLIVTSPIWFTPAAPLSIDENLNNDIFNFFPNPATKKLSLSFAFNHAYAVYVYDVSGRLIKELRANEKQTELDLSDLKRGLYSLKVIQDNKVSIKKLLIE